jgi:FkbM family methyltransferase
MGRLRPADPVDEPSAVLCQNDAGQLTRALQAGIRLHHGLAGPAQAAPSRSRLSVLAVAFATARDRLRQLRRPRLEANEILVSTPYGRLIVPAEDETLVRYVSDGGVLEPGTTSVITRLLHPGDTFIDVGANIGLLTLPAARCVGRRGMVIAIEPVPRLANLLRRSLALNGVAARVRVEQCAAGDVFGSARMHVGTILGHSSLLPLNDVRQVIEVPVRRVDAIVAPGSKVTLVKIDVEGYEIAVWRGMQRVRSDNPNVAVIVEFGPTHLARAHAEISTWLDTFRQEDFVIYEIDELTGVCRPLREEGLENVVSMNLLLVRGLYPDAVPTTPV